jgi:hypothetical protein
MSTPNGPRIAAGMWRPQYPWEHIAWISPPWGNDDFLWLDFPEAIFSDQGLLYLSHVNSQFPSMFPDLAKVEWQECDGEIRYQRTLPNLVSFRGVISGNGQQSVDLRIQVFNGSNKTLTTIRLQTCLFMRAYYPLSAYTLSNKWIHTKSQGWIDLDCAKTLTDNDGQYYYGWRGGRKIADLPVIACQSTDHHAIAFSWLGDTYSLISNPIHPCIHADPAVPDLEPGTGYELKGEIFFANDGLVEVQEHYGHK